MRQPNRQQQQHNTQKDKEKGHYQKNKEEEKPKKQYRESTKFLIQANLSSKLNPIS